MHRSSLGRCRATPNFAAVLLYSLCGLLLTTASAFAYNPNQPQGFGNERSYHTVPGMPDHVDLFSGRLSATLPVGPFQLVYTNNVWRYENVIEGGQPKIQATPDRLNSAGLGWHLGWGELYEPSHWYNDSDQGLWLYVGDDGSRHHFYTELHRGEVDGEPDIYYTRDGSYLRLRKIISGSTWEIEFPDGSTRRFVKGGPVDAYRLVKSWSGFASESSPDLTVSYNADDTERTLTDRFGRTHYVRLAKTDDILDGAQLAWMVRAVTEIDLEAEGGTRAIYQLSYRNIQVDLSCKNTSSAFGPRMRLPHLTRVQLPDGTAYSMEQGGVPSYANNCQGAMDDLPGSLTRMELPTGGVLRYTYQNYVFPPGTNASPFNSATGVATREMVKADGTVLGSWTYRTTNLGGTSTTDPEVRTEVVALPEGDCRKHYFNARYYQTPSVGQGWEYGLPFSYLQSAGGKYLSVEVYDDHAANGSCAGTKVRSHFVRYRRDAIPGTGTAPLNQWYDTNRTLEASRTVFHDDGDKWTDIEFSEFDGLGNFRRQVATGNLWSGSSNNERRETTIDYSRSTGLYPGTFTPISGSTPWTLRVFDSIEASEADALGEASQRIETRFDDASGALLCSRILRSGTSRGDKDLILTYGYDGIGQLTDEKRYGGDWWTIPTTGADCGDLPTQPEFWTRHTYAHGTRISTRPKEPNGANGPFLTYDVDVDPNTGWVTTSRDASGFEIDYEYDSMGRVTSIQPQQGNHTDYAYAPAAFGQGRTLTVSTKVPGTQNITSSEQVVFDDFGRLRLERRLMPDGSWSQRETLRNARGWKLSRSEWGVLFRKTEYLNFDPFGRPSIVRPPEGAVHDVTWSHQGVRRSERTEQVKTSISGALQASTRTWERDAHGRLRTTEEPAGSFGSQMTLSHRYDVGGRLTEILSTAGVLQQTRSFTYDNRGFLLTETHPEKGASGNGTMTYTGYDSLGRPHAAFDGPHRLLYEYDFMGRITATRDLNKANRITHRFVYDGASGRGMGKIWKAGRYNYFDMPWDASTDEKALLVQQNYSYNAIGGETNTRDTMYIYPSGSFEMVRTEYRYDQDRNLDRITYPRCLSAPCAGQPAETSFALTMVYTNGRLTSIPGVVTDIDYHPSDLLESIQHANGVTDNYSVGLFRKGRTTKFFTTGVQGSGSNYDSGDYAFDGAGNIVRQGLELYAYDKAGRLTEAQVVGAVLPTSYSYDAFGNLSESYTPGYQNYAVDSATNRVGGAIYDGVGNITSWGGNSWEYNVDDQVVRQNHLRYIYDALGERAGTVPVDTGGVVTLELHVRDLKGRLLSKLLRNGTSYTRMEDSVYAGNRLVALNPNGPSTLHFHGDHLGTARLITSSTGQVADQPTILPFGQEVYSSLVSNRKLSGHERDFSTGADYMHARHYLAELGRFLGVDPRQGSSASPQSLNRYAYVLNSPVRYYDPTGFSPSGEESDEPSNPGFSEEIDVVGELPEIPRLPGSFPRRFGGNGGGAHPFGDGPGGFDFPEPDLPGGIDLPGDGEGGADPDAGGEVSEEEGDKEENPAASGCDPRFESCDPPPNCGFNDPMVPLGVDCDTVIDLCAGLDGIGCAIPGSLDDWGIKIPRDIEVPGTGITVDPCKMTRKICSVLR
ncbi:MAG: RHS repeat-associated core domain-containing protein [Acidobacteriota bacterium]